MSSEGLSFRKNISNVISDIKGGRPLAVHHKFSLLHQLFGGELIPGDGQEKQGKVNASSAYLDGMQFLLPAYNIEGNNYVKLRDIGELLDFNVSWDGADNVIRIDTGEVYTAD